MKIIDKYDRKYFAAGFVLFLLTIASHFLGGSFYKLVTLSGSILFWVAVILLFIKKFRLKARSFLLGLFLPLVLLAVIGFLAVIIFSILG